MTDGVRIAPFGDAAVLVELRRRGRDRGGASRAGGGGGDRGDPPRGAGARRARPGRDERPRAVRPARHSRSRTSRRASRRVLERAPATADPPHDAPLHELAVRYGGDDGPDLASVAEEVGLSPAGVIELHAATTYEVLFLGFAPGFAYLGELAPPLVVPRLATPRPRVPAGSVAIAGPMTAVYPHASPGGWRLLGRTDARLFDPAATPPARLRPGRSRPVRARLTWHATPSSRSSTRASSCRSRTADAPGMAARGRHAGRRRGPPLARRGQRARRQPAGRGRARGDAPRADRAGARVRSRSGSRARWREPSRRPASASSPARPSRCARATRSASSPRPDARGYLAVPGGIDVPVVLGSRSTALGAGFGGLDGRALRAGDRLAPAADRAVPPAHWPGVPAPGAVSTNQPAPRPPRPACRRPRRGRLRHAPRDALDHQPDERPRGAPPRRRPDPRRPGRGARVARRRRRHHPAPA